MRLFLLLLYCSAVSSIPPTLISSLNLKMIDTEYKTSTIKLIEKLMDGLHNETTKFSGNGTNFLNELMEKVDEFSIQHNGSLSCISDLGIILGTSLCSLHPSNLLCRENVASWSLRLLDSWPRLPSGLMRRGPFFFLGDYDQCLELITEQKPVHYCTLHSSVKMEFDIPVTTGVCLPSSCSSEVVETLFNLIVEQIAEVSDIVGFTVGIETKNVKCQGDDHEWNNAKTILMMISTAMCCLLAGGTLFDYSIRSRPQEERRPAGRDEEDKESVYSEDGKPLFNAPSIALTYRSMPDLKKTLSTRAVLIDILCAFSIRISLNHLFRNSAREIPILNGIKVLSAFWVILGHSCLFSLPYIDTVQAMASQPVSSWLSSLLFNSSLSVDTFLFIAGAVLAFTVRKRIIFRGHREDESIPQRFIRLGMFYLHRTARLWPAMFLSVFFITYFYNHLGNGPMWDTNGMFGTQCSWSSILVHLTFLSNFFPSHCLPWLWHISLDLQFYLLSPLFLYVLKKKSPWFFGCAAFMILLSLCYRTAVYIFFQLPANMFMGMLKDRKMEEGELAFRLLYASPLSRSPPFLIGLTIGWIVCVRNTKKVPFIAMIGLKCVTLYLLIYSLFAPFSSEGIPSLIHAVLYRTLWSLALASMVWLSEHGHLSAISYLLSSPKLLPVARLSFGIYLTHEPILLWLVWTQRQPASPNSFGHFLLLAATVTALSLVASFVFAICFQLPVLNIERRLFKKTERSFNRTKNITEESFSGDKWVGEEDMCYSEKTKRWLTDTDNPYTTICHMNSVNLCERDQDEVDCEPPVEEWLFTAAEKSDSQTSLFELDSLTVVEREQLLSSRC